MSKLDSFKDRTVIIPASFSLLDIASDLGHNEAVDLIAAIDLAQQDSGFTSELIMRLFRCLRDDLDFDDGKALLKELKKINKECGK